MYSIRHAFLGVSQVVVTINCYQARSRILFSTHHSRHQKHRDEETFTVVFHALLSDKFKWDENKKIIIRGEEPVFYGWNADMILMNTEKYVSAAKCMCCMIEASEYQI